MSEEEQQPDENAGLSQTELSQKRTGLSEHRTGLSEHRTELSEHRTGLSEERTGMSHERTDLSHERTELSVERTMLSHERTLMSWIRTSTSLITFGFTLYKFFEETQNNGSAPRMLTPRIVGMVMILFGLVALFFAEIQHRQSIKRLKKYGVNIRRSISFVLAILVLVFGIALLLGAIFRL